MGEDRDPGDYERAATACRHHAALDDERAAAALLGRTARRARVRANLAKVDAGLETALHDEAVQRAERALAGLYDPEADDPLDADAGDVLDATTRRQVVEAYHLADGGALDALDVPAVPDRDAPVGVAAPDPESWRETFDEAVRDRRPPSPRDAYPEAFALLGRLHAVQSRVPDPDRSVVDRLRDAVPSLRCTFEEGLSNRRETVRRFDEAAAERGGPAALARLYDAGAELARSDEPGAADALDALDESLAALADGGVERPALDDPDAEPIDVDLAGDVAVDVHAAAVGIASGQSVPGFRSALPGVEAPPPAWRSDAGSGGASRDGGRDAGPRP